LFFFSIVPRVCFFNNCSENLFFFTIVPRICFLTIVPKVCFLTIVPRICFFYNCSENLFSYNCSESLFFLTIVPRVCFLTIVPTVFFSMLLHKHKIITLSQGALIKIEWRGKFASYLFDYYLLQYIYLLESFMFSFAQQLSPMTMYS
jgi:hypothetical protein